MHGLHGDSLGNSDSFPVVTAGQAAGISHEEGVGAGNDNGQRSTLRGNAARWGLVVERFQYQGGEEYSWVEMRGL